MDNSCPHCQSNLAWKFSNLLNCYSKKTQCPLCSKDIYNLGRKKLLLFIIILFGGIAATLWLIHYLKLENGFIIGQIPIFISVIYLQATKTKQWGKNPPTNKNATSD